MTTYYLLICAGSVINETTRFYRIAVGSTAADAARVHALQVLAASQQWYFSKYSHDTADFLLRISLSLCRQPDDLNMRIVKISLFLSAWKSFCKGVKPAEKRQNKTTKRQKTTHFSEKNKSAVVLQTAEAGKRIKPKLIVTDFTDYLNSIL